MTSSWKQAVFGLVVGLLLGAAATFLALRHGPFRHQSHSAEARATRMVERFTRELDMTSEQKAKVSAILEGKRDAIRSLDDEMRPRFQEIRQSIREEIRKILTPEQQAEFEEMEKKRRSRRMDRTPENRGITPTDR